MLFTCFLGNGCVMMVSNNWFEVTPGRVVTYDLENGKSGILEDACVCTFLYVVCYVEGVVEKVKPLL